MPRKAHFLSGAVRAVAVFALTIGIGTVLLRFPFATNGKPMKWMDSFFTSTSAVCVTGLSTVDIGTSLSYSGQMMLLGLIQLGGLGITTISTFLLVAAGRATLAHHVETQEQLGSVRISPSRLLWWVVSSTILVETVGALILASRLPETDRWWSAIFHGVSAFCNSGFSLYPDSLTRFRSDSVVNAVVAALTIFGGAGFIVHLQLVKWAISRMTGQRLPLFLHTKVVLSASAALWIMGTVVFLLFESNNTMKNMTPTDRVVAAVFQSVSTRTAGFSTLDFGTMREVTLFAVMFFMLIGAGSGSCAGGIKVTTAAVLFATIRARIRGEDSVSLLNRAIPPAIVRRAFHLLILSLVFISLMLLLLLFVHEKPPSQGARNDQLTVLAFETVSAFGTVGLSTGVTTSLSALGKLIIIFCMFVGRLGPLVIALAVLPERIGPRFEYPREDLAIG